MIYSAKEGTRLRRERTREAISLAMKGCWKEAVAVNREILESLPTDVDALNRLGRALAELGRYGEAKEAYSRASELEPDNSIAQKNLNRLYHITKLELPAGGDHKVDPGFFIWEAGRTAVISLKRLAPKEVLARLMAGEQVRLEMRGEGLVVENSRGEYLGEVESAYSSRLTKLIEDGNRYVAAIASLGEELVKVIIREVFQHPSQVGRISFPPSSVDGFRPDIRGRPLYYQTGEEEWGETWFVEASLVEE